MGHIFLAIVLGVVGTSSKWWTLSPLRHYRFSAVELHTARASSASRWMKYAHSYRFQPMMSRKLVPTFANWRKVTRSRFERKSQTYGQWSATASVRRCAEGEGPGCPILDVLHSRRRRRSNAKFDEVGEERTNDRDG